MIAQPITVNLPALLYDRLKRRAEQAHTTIEQELVQVVASVVPVDETLDPKLNATVEQLNLLDDEALWRAARSTLAVDITKELETLHSKRQRAGLTSQEQQTLQDHLTAYEQTMLVRAHAAALLRQRGHDVSELWREL
jgi:hypothetical protein